MHRGDNTGPAPLEDVAGFYASLQGRFPAANVSASTFDAFFKVANQPEVKGQLPVVTQEIGDGWLYGVPSDPLKNAQFREVARQRLDCIESGLCDAAAPEMRAFDRLLVKVPEHTYVECVQRGVLFCYNSSLRLCVFMFAVGVWPRDGFFPTTRTGQTRSSMQHAHSSHWGL